MKYLLDTCVISEFVAKKPSARVLEWLDRVDDRRVHLSVITIGEIKKGICEAPRRRACAAGSAAVSGSSPELMRLF